MKRKSMMICREFLIVCVAECLLDVKCASLAFLTCLPKPHDLYNSLFSFMNM